MIYKRPGQGALPGRNCPSNCTRDSQKGGHRIRLLRICREFSLPLIANHRAAAASIAGRIRVSTTCRVIGPAKRNTIVPSPATT